MACGRCEDCLCGLYAVILKYACVVLCIHNAHALVFSYRGGVGEQRLSEADQMEIWVRLKHWCGSRAHAGAKESRHAIYMLHLRGCLIACLRTWPSGVV